jgi:putative membrane-bound dehydrogenase-like protein
MTEHRERSGIRRPVRLTFAAFLMSVAALHGQAQIGRPIDRLPLSPAEALATFVVEPGYRVELVAAEPLVQSPVAMAFDEAGRMYVAENRGYPDPLTGEPARAAEGVIARLTDTDGDGRYETRTEFATGLTYPNGVMPWDGGVFVTAAPDLLYLKDTTGDGVADERRVVLTGFNNTSTAQIRVSHPTLGMDNWIYLTSGLNGGAVTVPARPEQPAVKFSPSDSRVHPRTLEFELTGGRSQFCLTFDNAGRRFTCANRQPLWHAVLEPWHLARNPAYAFSQTMEEVAAFGAAGTVWPISPDLTTASLNPRGTPHAGTFTAASGAYIDRGTALAAGHAGSVFICESAQNLVQRQVLTPDGVSFRARPAREGAEFLASRDTWFRPVFAAGGPDGALYVVDMYRKDIDHPSYVPEASRPAMDFTAGKTRGRIYRVVASDWVRPREAIGGTLGVGPDRAALDRAPVESLVGLLDHPNGWHRDTAQRLIVERQDRGAAPALAARAARPGAPGRVHALWALDGLGALDVELVMRAMSDPDPDVRENALRLAEPRVAASPALAEAVLGAAGDAEPRVRLRAALAAGNIPDARAIDTFATLAARHGADRWMRAAIVSGLAGRADAFFAAFMVRPADVEVRRAVVQDAAQLFGAGEPLDRVLTLIPAIAAPDAPLAWQAAALGGLLNGLRTRKMTTDTPSRLLSILSGETAAARAARAAVDALLARAASAAADETAAPDERVAAIGLLAQADWRQAAPQLTSLLDPRQPTAVQAAAARALGDLPEAAGAAASLLDRTRWVRYTPQVRETVLQVLVGRDANITVLLDALERGDIDPSTIPPGRRSRLEQHPTEAHATRAQRIFARTAGPSGSREVYERLRPAVDRLTGSADRGAPLFATHCRACHTFNDGGGAIGPDLSGVRSQPADALLRHILVPEAEITAGYETYVAELRDGRTIAGRIESEAPQSLTLRDAASVLHTVLRSDLAAVSRQPGSLMPAGFDQALSAQELADLIAYLRSSNE